MAPVLDFAFLLFLILLGVAVVALMVAATWAAVSSSPREVALDYEVSWKPTTTVDYLAEHVSAVIHDAGYSTDRDALELRYSRTHRRIWLIILVLLFFPISLLLLLAAKTVRTGKGLRRKVAQQERHHAHNAGLAT